MIDPLKQTILSQIFIETLPDVVSFRYQLIKREGYKRYLRRTRRLKGDLIILAKRDRKTVEEYGLDWIYSIFQSKICRNNRDDYQQKVQHLLIYLEEMEYFKKDGNDSMFLEIVAEYLSRGEVVR